MTDPKIKTVQAVYEAFGRGDVGFIVDQVTDDVDWASCPDSDIAPWHGMHRGKAEVPGFFKALAENLQVTEFTPLSFTSNETDVMVVTRFVATAPATGKSATMDIHHWWRFRDGKICLYRGTEDSAQTQDLLRGSTNRAAIKGIYDAFGRGDIAAILGKIAPDCGWESWENNRAQRQGVPTLQPRTGPAGVAQFFAAVGELEIHDFQVLDILASERQVAAEVVIDFSTPAGGRSRDEELHLWTLNDHHQVTRLRHYVDTAKHIAAFAGEDTT